MSDGFIGTKRVAAPDLVDYVVGLRGFDRSGHQLASPFQGDIWPTPGRRAECNPAPRATRTALMALGAKPAKASAKAKATLERQWGLPAHGAPDLKCHCGLYAYHGEEDKLALHPIVAIVRAWGRLIVHARGFRAQHVEVAALAFDPDLGDSVEDQRIREATRRAAVWWRIPLLPRDQLLASLSEFGSPIPVELRPRDPEKEDGQ